MSTNYPYSEDTNTNFPNLYFVSNPTTLSSSISALTTTIPVASTAQYPTQNGLIIIDNEQIFYSSTTSNSFLGCIRGYFGTIPAPHNNAAVVNSYVTPQLYTNLRDAIMQIEALLGVNASNVALLQKNNIFTGQQTIGSLDLQLNLAGSQPDEWHITPTNNGTQAVLNFSYSGSATSNFVNVTAQQVVQPAPDVVPFSTTPIFNNASSLSHSITLTGNVTSSSFEGLIAGQHISMQIFQDSVGGRTFVYPPQVKNGMTVGTEPNSCTVQLFYYDGTYAWPYGYTNQT